MKIQRYLAKDKEELDSFGIVNSRIHHWDYDWHMGKNKIGITPNSTTEAESFFEGLLVADDELIVFPSKDNPAIKRRSNPCATIGSSDSRDPKERSDLVKMIIGNELIHLYSGVVYTYTKILIFSQDQPSGSLYTPGKILPVTVDNYLLRLEKCLRKD